MPVACTACQASLPIDHDKSVGRQLRCPFCQASFVVPAEAPPAPRRPRDRAPLLPALLLGGVLVLMLLPLAGLAWHLGSRQRPGRDADEPRLAQHTPAAPDAEKPPRQRDSAAPATKPPFAAADDVPPRREEETPAARTFGPLDAPPERRLATFMGASAAGERFCIIADTSGSMSLRRRLERLKKEVKSTLDGLSPNQEVHVIFFHSRPEPQPEKGWLRAADSGRILPWVERQTPRGGTEPMGAFRLAFELEPRPDAVFFMTDGMIPLNVPPAVAKLNDAGRKVPIHAILFGGDFSPVFPPNFKIDEKRMEQMKAQMEKQRKLAVEGLERLAKDSGGEYRFVADDPAPTDKK